VQLNAGNLVTMAMFDPLRGALSLFACLRDHSLFEYLFDAGPLRQGGERVVGRRPVLRYEQSEAFWRGRMK